MPPRRSQRRMKMWNRRILPFSQGIMAGSARPTCWLFMFFTENRKPKTENGIGAAVDAGVALTLATAVQEFQDLVGIPQPGLYFQDPQEDSPVPALSQPGPILGGGDQGPGPQGPGRFRQAG